MGSEASKAAAPAPDAALLQKWQQCARVHFAQHAPLSSVINTRTVLVLGADGVGKLSLMDALADPRILDVKDIEPYPPILPPLARAPRDSDARALGSGPYQVRTYQHPTLLRFALTEVPYLKGAPAEGGFCATALHGLLDALATYDGMYALVVLVVSHKLRPHERRLVNAVRTHLCRVSGLPLLVVMTSATAAEMPDDAVRAHSAAALHVSTDSLLPFRHAEPWHDARRLRHAVFESASKVAMRLPSEHTCVWRHVLRLFAALHGDDTSRFDEHEWHASKQLAHLGLDAAAVAQLSQHALLQPSYDLPFVERVILLFGVAGAGKTSTMNALTGLNCDAGDSVVGVTKDFQSGQFLDADGATIVTVIDTAGLSEPKSGTRSDAQASRLLLDALHRFDGRLNGLCFVFGNNRFLDTDATALSVFYRTVCGSAIPLAMLSTRFMFEQSPDDWKRANIPKIVDLIAPFADASVAQLVEPVQFVGANSGMFQRDKFEDSLQRGRALILSTASRAGQTLPRPKRGFGYKVLKFMFRLRHPREVFPAQEVAQALSHSGYSEQDARWLAQHPLFQ